jgi:nucleotide-binding universal stress UspA family protein
VILVAYDGSADAQAAVAQAGALFPGEPATVLTVWEPFVELVARSGAGLGMIGGVIDTSEIDTANQQSALERARDGAARADAAGLKAEARERAQVTTTADAVLAEAAEVGARAIVMGTRGLTGIKSVLLGSVSHAVVHHADRPVVIVPSP